MPKPIVDKLNAELRGDRGARGQEQLEAMGGDPRATTPEEMRALVARQHETWKRLAVEANMSID